MPLKKSLIFGTSGAMLEATEAKTPSDAIAMGSRVLGSCAPHSAACFACAASHRVRTTLCSGSVELSASLPVGAGDCLPLVAEVECAEQADAGRTADDFGTGPNVRKYSFLA